MFNDIIISDESDDKQYKTNQNIKNQQPTQNIKENMLPVQNIKENYSYQFRRNQSTGEILLELFNGEKITKDEEKVIIELKDIISSQIKLDQIEHGSIIANSLNEIFQTLCLDDERRAKRCDASEPSIFGPRRLYRTSR